MRMFFKFAKLKVVDAYNTRPQARAPHWLITRACDAMMLIIYAAGLFLLTATAMKGAEKMVVDTGFPYVLAFGVSWGILITAAIFARLGMWAFEKGAEDMFIDYDQFKHDEWMKENQRLAEEPQYILVGCDNGE